MEQAHRLQGLGWRIAPYFHFPLQAKRTTDEKDSIGCNAGLAEPVRRRLLGDERAEHDGEYVDDATITARVKTKFAEDKTVAATRISVETLKGVVQLSGFATSEAERQRAAQLAATVPGVKSVQNAVKVSPPQS